MVERADFVGRIGAYLVRSSSSILSNLAFTSLSNKLPIGEARIISGMSGGESAEHHRVVGKTRGELSTRHSPSTDRLRAVFEGLAVGMILKDAEGKPLETNPALRRMLGYGEEELRGMLRSDFTVPKDAERDAELYRQLLAGERDSFRIGSDNLLSHSGLREG